MKKLCGMTGCYDPAVANVNGLDVCAAHLKIRNSAVDTTFSDVIKSYEDDDLRKASDG